MIRAVLGNAAHPEYGVATIPFPIPEEEYERILDMMEALEIGDAVRRDCHIEEMRGDVPALRCMENTSANLDELDYLAKRLDSFDDYEKAQFQCAASRLELHSVDELINLTFCCQDATVITDFSDLERIGRQHYLTVNGCASAEDFARVRGTEVARSLIDYEVGRVTPYGVVYDNEMHMEEVYDGRHFPEYRYKDCMLELELTRPGENHGATLYLPMEERKIERAMLRAGVTDGEMFLRFRESELPMEADVLLDFEHETLVDLNEMCRAVAPLSSEDRTKLGAVIQYAQPAYSYQIQVLAKNLDSFSGVEWSFSGL